MFSIGQEGFEQAIDPPISASGFHRQITEPIDSNLQNRSRQDSENDLSPKKKDEITQKQQQEKGCTRFCKIEYYKQYFNINEGEVISRLKGSVSLPHRNDFLERTKNNPDFYGPFWILTTLIVLVGTVGNFSNYLLSLFSDEQVWQKYFFKLEYIRQGIVFVYSLGLGIPALFYLYYKFMAAKTILNLPELICLYGYSLAAFLPAVSICIIPIGFIQWIVMICAAVNSILFLYANLKNFLEGLRTIVLAGAISMVQVCLMLALKMHFLSLLQSK